MIEYLKSKVKNACILQAKFLLEGYGEFFPFAFGVISDIKIVPVDTYFEEEHPTSNDVIEHLEKALKRSNEDNRFECVAICVDVLVIPPYLNEKIDALEIRIDYKNDKSVNYIIPYKREGKGQFVFLEEYEVDGTFNFYH